jgi:hypothetical protein
MNLSLLGLLSTYQSTGSASGSGTAANTTTVTKLADGSTVSTVRAPTAAIIAVTTSGQGTPPTSASVSYGVDVTA